MLYGFFLTFMQILQGSVATHVMRSWLFNDTFTTNLLLSPVA